MKTDLRTATNVIADSKSEKMHAAYMKNGMWFQACDGRHIGMRPGLSFYSGVDVMYEGISEYACARCLKGLASGRIAVADLE